MLLHDTPTNHDVAADYASRALASFCSAIPQSIADEKLIAYLATYPKLLQDHVDAATRLSAAHNSTILRGIVPILLLRFHQAKRAVSQYDSFKAFVLLQPRFSLPITYPSPLPPPHAAPLLSIIPPEAPKQPPPPPIWLSEWHQPCPWPVTAVLTESSLDAHQPAVAYYVKGERPPPEPPPPTSPSCRAACGETSTASRQPKQPLSASP